MKTLFTALVISAAAYGQFSSGIPNRSVARKVLSAITAPEASAPVTDAGRSNHLLMVESPGATGPIGGLVCRLEASFDGTNYVPISDDIVYLPRAGNRTYAMIRANGVYPAVRANCPTVPGAAAPLNAFYVGSQFPFGDVGFTGDRYLTSSVGSDVSKLAPPAEPTSSDGIQQGQTFTKHLWWGASDHTSLVDNGNGTLTYTTTASDNTGFFCGHRPECEVNPNIYYADAGTWNKVALKFSPWGSNTNARWQALLIGSQTFSSNRVLWIAFGFAKLDSDSGNYHVTVALWPNSDGQTGYDAAGSDPYTHGKTVFSSAALSATPPANVIFEVTHTAATLSFRYSLDGGTNWVQAASFADNAFDYGSGWTTNSASTPAQWVKLGLHGNIGGTDSLPNATAPDTFNIQRFKWY
jgi:hypothetical protein